MGNTATVIHYGVTGRDRLNKPITGELSRVPTRCRLEQSGTTEADTYVVNVWRGYFPAATQISAGDKVEENGRLFTVEGTPALNRVPGVPGADHLAVVLKYVGAI